MPRKLIRTFTRHFMQKENKKSRKLLSHVLDTLFGKSFMDNLGGSDFILDSGFVLGFSTVLNTFLDNKKLKNLRKLALKKEQILDTLNNDRSIKMNILKSQIVKLRTEIEDFEIQIKQQTYKLENEVSEKLHLKHTKI